MPLDCSIPAKMLENCDPTGAGNTAPGLTDNCIRGAIMADTIPTPGIRICEACGRPYPKRPGVSRGQFERSRACSRSCSTRLGHPNRKWPTLLERFWAKVDKAPGYGPWGDCWVWTAYRDEFGYGRLNRRGFSGGMAHRTSYDINVGTIPPGMMVRHRCDNPSCVRPDHLELGTAQQNSDDQTERGRQRAPKGAAHHSNKLTDDQARAIFYDPRTQREIAAEYGISQSAVMMIKTKRNWRHLWDEA